jgi:predicted CxxxxCH...CXXCH cytochrome family protein
MQPMSREQKMKKTVIITAVVALMAIVRCSEQGSEPSGVSVKTCGICHALPPADTNHTWYFLSVNRGITCAVCHQGYSADSGKNSFFVNDITHMNGRKDAGFVASPATCNMCHDVPPRDRGHALHVDTLHNQCSYCHAGYSANAAQGTFSVNSATHMNGNVDVVFSSPWSDSGRAAYDRSRQTCSNVYCHGAIHQGTRAAVRWGIDTLSITRCDACHNLTGIYAGHYVHARQPVYQGIGPSRKLILGGSVDKCDNCHAGFSTVNKTVNTAIHIDGTVTEPTCGGSGCHDATEWTTWSEYLQKHPTPPLSKMLLKALSSAK